MLIVHVFVHVKPDKIEAFKTATIENAQHSLKESGVARFDIIQQQDDPTRFVLVEVYRTPDDPACPRASLGTCRSVAVRIRPWPWRHAAGGRALSTGTPAACSTRAPSLHPPGRSSGAAHPAIAAQGPGRAWALPSAASADKDQSLAESEN